LDWSTEAVRAQVRQRALPRCAACTPEETPPEVAVGGEGISLLQSFCTALHIARVILCRN
jgi:hypothetical protein